MYAYIVSSFNVCGSGLLTSGFQGACITLVVLQCGTGKGAELL